MNSICANQNKNENILLLKAQRHLYARAKYLARAYFIVSIPLIIVCGVIATSFEAFKSWYALVALLAVVGGVFFKYFISTYRESAAQVQSEFDSNTLEVSTNKFLVQNKISYEDVKHHADRVSERDSKKLDDWYPKAACDLPLAYGRLVCQRANCYWNFNQRKRYIAILWTIVAVSVIAVLGIGLALSSTLADILLFMVLPLLPIIDWSINEIASQHKAHEALKCLKTSFEALFSDIKEKRCSEDDLNVRSVQIQDAIYVRRSSDPLIPNFLYWSFRDEQESEMQFSADTLVKEIKAAL